MDRRRFSTTPLHDALENVINDINRGDNEEPEIRILVDLDDKQINALDSMSKDAKRSRAALIREAVGEYLDRRRPPQPRDAFGLWGKGEIDGLAYQDQIRTEW